MWFILYRDGQKDWINVAQARLWVGEDTVSRSLGAAYLRSPVIIKELNKRSVRKSESISYFHSSTRLDLQDCSAIYLRVKIGGVSSILALDVAWKANKPRIHVRPCRPAMIFRCVRVIM